MRRLLLALFLTACASPAVDVGDDPGADLVTDGTKDDGASGLPVIYDNGSVSVVSDTAVANDAPRWAKMIEDVYQFDLDELKWSSPPLLSAQPLKLQALSPTLFQKLHPGTAAVAMGTGTIASSIAVLSRAGTPGVLAHEVSHIQMAREGGGLPHVFEEGKAGVLQRQYLIKLGVPVHPAPIMLSADRQTAADRLDGFMYQPYDISGGQEPLAVLFIEYLRVGLGYGDAMMRMAWLVETIQELKNEGWTESLPRFQRAFDVVFGMKFADARAAYLDYVQATEGNAAQRLAGTVLQSD
jgi:hypothetical protein